MTDKPKGGSFADPRLGFGGFGFASAFASDPFLADTFGVETATFWVHGMTPNTQPCKTGTGAIPGSTQP